MYIEMKQLKIFVLVLPVLFGSIELYSQQYPYTIRKSNKDSFSMIIVPDPQCYIKYSANQPLFELQLAWIEKNIDSLDIVAALVTGDLVEQNDRLATSLSSGISGDQPSVSQWKNVSRAFERLDNKLPYILSTGNHDYGFLNSENRESKFMDYFQVDRNSKWENTLVATTTNISGVNSLENAAYEFVGETWGKILVISIEFAPRDEVINWAKNLVNSKKYIDHKVILLTHSYMDTNGSRPIKENYQLSQANYGQAIWDSLVYPSKNIGFVLCGHSGSTPNLVTKDYSRTTSFRVDTNFMGKSIPQMMFNSQQADGSWNGNGGDGWLRILEFMPDGKTVKVRTFSPLFALSPLTVGLAWRREKYDEFEFIIER